MEFAVSRIGTFLVAILICSVSFASGYLSPGAVVRIPSQITSKHNLEANPSEAALSDWLSSKGELRSYQTASGKTERDFFFPVEVVEPKNSKGVTVGSVIYAPIRFLSRVRGTLMVVEADPEMAQSQEQLMSTSAPPKVPKAGLSTLVPTRKPAAVGANVIAFLPFIEKHLEKVDAGFVSSIKNRQDPLAAARNYNSTCPGNFNDFKREIAQAAIGQKVPVEILMSIMHMETNGRCAGIKNKPDPSANVGLFQVNINTSQILRCNAWQMETLRKAKTVAQLKDGSLKCLENPIANLNEALQILRSKYAAVNTQKQPEVGRWDQANALSHDDWRKALAAYNGGQSYVFQSYYDILAYNAKHNVNFDPYSWENRRLFFFRRVLDRKQDQMFFGNNQKYKRGLRAILTNIVYVESIAGREAKPDESQHSLVMQWIRDLYQPPVRGPFS